ncbi:DHH family phosphoesterase [Ligilactobacillus ceti]|uniref:Phosphoesterase, DHH family protein n=1 Tax=Ligilactobacillus ceti DSM 22408 TaxID=1122146 RepID=A0A0R2KIM9_9LACO|nr:bifunctional oligoribonuclease/PAP phosphatase NrnA [Ligilactobacillus ceti]KRN89035.1 phosphoesterase, DHH family protein [Ligilactobacillus ceti DSM 22408]
MDIKQKIIALIKQYDKIIIHRHQRPDPDAYGSQGGLADVIRASFPMKTVYLVGKDIKGLRWIDQPEEISDEQYEGALVIVTDTANAPRIDDQRYDLGSYLLKIDHHPNDEPYGDLMWVNDKASSCSEMIVDLVNSSQGELKLTPEAAAKLYAGIVGDTGRFMYNSTTSETMRMTALLMDQGIDIAKINRKLDDITLPVAHLSAYVLDNLQFTPHNAAYVILNQDTLASFELGDASTASVVPLIGKIEDVVCWTVFVQQDDGSYRLRIRSKGPVINELAKEYQGGGHPLASGALITDESQIEEYIAKLDAIAATDTGE